MSEETTRSPGPSRGGCVVALFLILLPGVGMSLWSGPMPGEEWPFALFYGLLLAIPFGYLALDGSRDWLPWLVAGVLTALFWGGLIASAIISARDHTGVNFAIGLAMLASPFVTTLGAWIANGRL